jgi:hypothetical protein
VLGGALLDSSGGRVIGAKHDVKRSLCASLVRALLVGRFSFGGHNDRGRIVVEQADRRHLTHDDQVEQRHEATDRISEKRAAVVGRQRRPMVAPAAMVVAEDARRLERVSSKRILCCV